MIRLTYPHNVYDAERRNPTTDWVIGVDIGTNSVTSGETPDPLILDLPNPLTEETHQTGRSMTLRRTRDHSLATYFQGCHLDKVSYITNYTFTHVSAETTRALKEFLTVRTVGKYFRATYFSNELRSLPVGPTGFSREDLRQPDSDWWCFFLENSFNCDLEPEWPDGGLYRFNLTLKRWSILYPTVYT